MSGHVRKPEWLKISIASNERYAETKRIVESHCLHTICSSGRCPKSAAAAVAPTWENVGAAARPRS